MKVFYRGAKTSNALETKNIDFRLENVHVVETEDGLLEAWEPKILIFLQDNEDF